MLLATVWIANSYFSRPDREVPDVPASAHKVLVETLFTPLQLETFQLAHELRQFLKSLGGRPVPKRNGKEWLPDGTAEWLVARNGAEQPWVSKLVHSYADQYAERVKHAMHELGAAGLSVFPLEPYTKTIVEESNVTDAANWLDRYALEAGAIQKAGNPENANAAKASEVRH